MAGGPAPYGLPVLPHAPRRRVGPSCHLPGLRRAARRRAQHHGVGLDRAARRARHGAHPVRAFVGADRGHHRPGRRLRARAGRRRLLPPPRAALEGPRVTVTQRGLAGAWKRIMAGLPVHMLDAVGPRPHRVQPRRRGRDARHPLHPARLDRRSRAPVHGRDALGRLRLARLRRLAPDPVRRRSRDRTTRSAGSWTASRRLLPPGLLLIHAHGNAFVRQLAHGERILVKPSALLYKDSTVSAHLHFERPQFRAAKHLDVGRAVPVARAVGSGPRRPPVGVRPHARPGRDHRRRRDDGAPVVSREE